jgi:hypothetical protein
MRREKTPITVASVGRRASVSRTFQVGRLPEAAGWRFHLAREHQRLYSGTKQGQYALGA